MLLPAHRLVDRLRHPRSRADELTALRRRFAEVDRAAASDDERAVAAQLRELRLQLSRALAGTTSCSSCARGYPLPHGRWDGGHCCGGRTEELFSEDEVAALALGGTRVSSLRAPTGDHAGCAFRGSEGCSLEVADRPNLCVRYVCRGLETELRGSGRWDEVRVVARRLRETFARFVALREERAAEEWVALRIE